MSHNGSGPASTSIEEGARKSDQLGSSIASENIASATTTQPFNWRAHLPVHPAADAFPQLSEKELKELAGDIKRNGLKTKIVVWAPKADAKFQLIDGRNRLDALALIGPLAVNEQGRLCTKGEDGALQKIKLEHFIGSDPEKHAYSLNLHRRHLTPKQKRELILRLLKEKPAASDRSIAKQLKVVSDKTVGAVRRAKEARAEIPHVETRTDTKGRKQPAKKATPKTKPRPASKPPRNLKRELEAKDAHIAEIEAAREHDLSLAEKLRAAEVKIAGLESEVEELKAENAKLREELATAKAASEPFVDDGLDIPECLRRPPKAMTP